MIASVSRRYRFAASHRLHAPALSDQENALIFGKCNNPYGHGHDYELSITVRGPVSQETGLVTSTGHLDKYVQERVVGRLASRNLNRDLPEFIELVPTTENLAGVIATLLSEGWHGAFPAGGPVLDRVHVQETGRNGFEFIPGRDAFGERGVA